MNDEIQTLRRENERLLKYIQACRARFGDAAVNAAIMELCPPTSVESRPRNPNTDIRDDWARVRALQNTQDDTRHE